MKIINHKTEGDLVTGCSPRSPRSGLWWGSAPGWSRPLLRLCWVWSFPLRGCLWRRLSGWRQVCLRSSHHRPQLSPCCRSSPRPSGCRLRSHPSCPCCPPDSRHRQGCPRPSRCLRCCPCCPGRPRPSGELSVPGPGRGWQYCLRLPEH